MISITHKGDFNKVERFMNRFLHKEYLNILAKYGEQGVRALSNASPVDTGRMKQSWNYEIERGFGRTSLWWTNSDIENGYNIAIILQYGHGTRNGAYVEGVDFINPALRPIFESIAEEAWKEVIR